MRTRSALLQLLLAFVLAWAGSAAQLHALSHAQHDLIAAASGDKAPSPLKHSTDQCLVVHALDGTAVGAATLFAAETFSQHVALFPGERHGRASHLAFRSRAPPVLS